MSKNWFGKECKHFNGSWEWCDVEADDTGEQKYKEYEPVLKYCNHPDNIKDHEGNCYAKICPLGLQDQENDLPKS
jgi:hypothetical protein